MIKNESELANDVKIVSKSFFKYAKRKSKDKMNKCPFKNETGEIMGTKEMAGALNKYLVLVFSTRQ